MSPRTGAHVLLRIDDAYRRLAICAHQKIYRLAFIILLNTPDNKHVRVHRDELESFRASAHNFTVAGVNVCEHARARAPLLDLWSGKVEVADSV